MAPPTRGIADWVPVLVFAAAAAASGISTARGQTALESVINEAPYIGGGYQMVEAVDAWLLDARAAQEKYGAINTWDTSQVQEAERLFNAMRAPPSAAFNADINGWQLSSVSCLDYMFAGAAEFDQPLDSWNTKMATTAGAMFQAATRYNQPMDSWQTGALTDMSGMFNDAASFDQPLNSWQIGKVTAISFMFFGATAFNGDVSAWDVSRVASMMQAFFQAPAFNANIARWNVSSTTEMTSMFHYAAGFSQDLSGWDVSHDPARGTASGYVNVSGDWNRSAAGAHGEPNRGRVAIYHLGKSYSMAGPVDRGFDAARDILDFAGETTQTPYRFRLVVRPETQNLAYFDPQSGGVVVAPGDADQVGRTFAAQLTAVPADGLSTQPILVAWEFTVAAPPKLQFAASHQPWAPGSSASVMNETRGYRDVFVAASQTGASVSYVLGAPPADLVDLATVTGDLVYSMSVSLGGHPAAGEPGKFFVDGTGETLAQPAIVNDTSLPDEYQRDYTGRLWVRDDSDSEPLLIKEWRFRVLRNDTDISGYGPDGRGCANGGRAVDGAPFDRKFTCACSGGYQGANCGVAAAAAAAAGGGTGGGTGGSTATTATIVALVAVVALMAGAAGYVKWQARREANKPVDFDSQLERLKEEGVYGFSKGTARVPRELKRGWLALVDKLGAGAFGDVWKGLLKDGDTVGVPEYMVAAKVVKAAAGGLDGAAAAAAEEELLNEALLMAQVETHANLVSLIGVVTCGQGQPKVLVLSYCEHGELLGQLKRRCADGKAFGEQTKFRFCGEVATGMRHLGEHGLVHRDLAARNVLLASGMVCKVADFGLSRRVQTEDNASDYYRSTSGIVPVRWTAPEGLSGQKFSAASDVWSFGIVCVEIFQDGEKPYPTTGSNPAVINLVTAGKVHPRPCACPPPVYAELKKCWCFAPDQRASFEGLAASFAKLAEAGGGGGGSEKVVGVGAAASHRDAGYDLGGGAAAGSGYDLHFAEPDRLESAEERARYDLGHDLAAKKEPRGDHDYDLGHEVASPPGSCPDLDYDLGVAGGARKPPHTPGTAPGPRPDVDYDLGNPWSGPAELTIVQPATNAAASTKPHQKKAKKAGFGLTAKRKARTTTQAAALLADDGGGGIGSTLI